MTCRAQALARSSDACKTENTIGKRKGCMELMKDLWEDKSLASFGFIAQNLRDKEAQVQKSKRYHVRSLPIEQQLYMTYRLITSEVTIALTLMLILK